MRECGLCSRRRLLTSAAFAAVGLRFGSLAVAQQNRSGVADAETIAGSRAQGRAAWMRKARWGVMTHYLADWISKETGEEMTVARWNRLVDRFDVEGLSQQIQSAGAGYHLMSIGQNSGYYLSSNATYDRLVGIRPSKCSHRDLIADLYRAHHRRGIRLMVYLPSGAPGGDRVAIEALGWKRGPYRNSEFQVKWQEVIREWSERWGRNVSGWWFDGCYWPNTMYRQSAPNFSTLAAAARAGNPESALGFNPGVFHRIHSITPCEDYTAGEMDLPAEMTIHNAQDGIFDGAQVHALSHLGEKWGMGAPRFSTSDLVGWSQKMTGQGGVFTWDTPIGTDGHISQPFVDQWKAIAGSFEKA